MSRLALSLAVLVLFGASVCAISYADAPAAKPAGGEEETKVRDVINAHFAAVRTGERAAVEACWDKSGQVRHIARSVDGKDVVKTESAIVAVRRWTSASDGKAAGKILGVRCRGRLAEVEVEFTWHGVRRDESLTLLKLNNAWKIVSKTFVSDAEEDESFGY